MLTFDIRCDDAPLPWRMRDGVFIRGASRIEPFRHRALETVVAASGTNLMVCVRERRATAPDVEAPVPGEQAIEQPLDRRSFETLAERLRRWPLQWHMIVVEGVSAEITAGAWGTAPLFLVEGQRQLLGDWDAAHLLPHLRRADLDPVRAVNWLADYATPYARETLFRGLHLVTERATARWRPDAGRAHGLTIAYPQAWPRPRAGVLRPDADPVAGFDDIVTAALQRWAVHGEAGLACEVSGGLDSSLVAAIAAKHHGMPMRSYGLAITGHADAVADQERRRGDLAATLNLDDVSIGIESHLPLAPNSSRLDGRAPALPWEEGYYEAMEALLQRASADGTAVLLTGFGGDELCMLRLSEERALTRSADPIAEDRPVPDAPPPVPASQYRTPPFLTAAALEALAEPLDEPPRAASSSSSVEVMAFSAARYMRHGIWPIHPLCSPEIVRFCARLPPEWRSGRLIERHVLARLGVPRSITHPAHNDTFGPALSLAMRSAARPTLERLFHDPTLVELGLVDGGELVRSYGLWRESGRRRGAEFFYAAAILELCLRGLRD